MHAAELADEVVTVGGGAAFLVGVGEDEAESVIVLVTFLPSGVLTAS
jgi:hypothetical protein